MHQNNSSLPSEQAASLTALNASLQRLFASIQDGYECLPAIQQCFELLTLPLGEEIIHVRPAGHAASSQQIYADFYLIVQGRARVLGVDTEGQEVSVLPLEMGDSVGADNLGATTLLPYRVVSSTPVQVARLSFKALHKVLTAMPQLRQHVQQTVQQRQALLFFKTLTGLRSVPSLRLQNLVPLLAVEAIQAGVALNQATPKTAGHFWLKQGQIQRVNDSSHHPQIGSDWGFPMSTPDLWTAATDLIVYRLPMTHWEQAIALPHNQ